MSLRLCVDTDGVETLETHVLPNPGSFREVQSERLEVLRGTLRWHLWRWQAWAHGESFATLATLVPARCPRTDVERFLGLSSSRLFFF